MTQRPTFLAPIDIGQGGPEPVVTVAEDGTVFVAAQDAAGGAPHFWASTDGGRTFRASSPSSQTGGEVDIATGPGPVVFYTQLGPSGNVILHSSDRGASWTSSPLATATTQYFDREWVALDASSAFIVARDFQRSSAVLSRSDDGGVTFLQQGQPWDASHEPGTTNGNLVTFPGGVALAYVCRDGNAVCVATSADRGVSWAQHVVASRSVAVDNVYPVLAADGQRLVVVWSDAESGRLSVWASRSDDRGASWAPAARVSDDSESATLAWVAANAGKTWVAYASTATALSSADDAAAARAPWSVMAARLDSGSLAVLTRGPAFPDPVHVGVISHPLGRGGKDGPFDRSFGDFLTVAVDGQGRAYVATVDTTRGAASDVLATQP